MLILIKAKKVDQTDDLVASLKASEVDMNVFPLSELLGTISALMASTKVFVSAIILIAIILGGVGVLNTVLMAVFERTREIGMMKAMGGSRSDVFKLVWAETILTTVLGGVVGVGDGPGFLAPGRGGHPRHDSLRAQGLAHRVLASDDALLRRACRSCSACWPGSTRRSGRPASSRSKR